jgi:hypothetical protein
MGRLYASATRTASAAQKTARHGSSSLGRERPLLASGALIAQITASKASS